MSFYKSHNGKPIDGSDKNTFVNEFATIPDNTFAKACVRKFELKEFDNHQTGHKDKVYQVDWQIVDGDFKNRYVRQKIKAFDMDADTHARALNMMVRIYNICDYKPTHDMAPSSADLLPIIGKLAGLRIQVWEMDGKEGNWVSEVHKLGPDFIAKTGFTHPKELPVSTAQQLTDNNALYGTSATGATHLTEHMQNNPGLYAGTAKEFDDDIPF